MHPLPSASGTKRGLSVRRLVLRPLIGLTLAAAITTPAMELSAKSSVIPDSEKALFEERVLMPSPGEIFAALDKLGVRDWNGAASFDTRYDYPDNVLRALNLGVRAADGFLAIQARDKAKLGEMIAVIMPLAEELMVGETLLAEGRRIEEMASREEWDALRMELDSLRRKIIAEMERLGDQDLALLVSAGGWLEGLRATTATLEMSYDPRASSLLHQPALVNHFITRIQELRPEMRNHPAVQRLSLELDSIRSLIDVDFGAPVPQENITTLHKLSETLVEEIEAG